jgi:hypothetical protein
MEIIIRNCKVVMANKEPYHDSTEGFTFQAGIAPQRLKKILLDASLEILDPNSFTPSVVRFSTIQNQANSIKVAQIVSGENSNILFTYSNSVQDPLIGIQRIKLKGNGIMRNVANIYLKIDFSDEEIYNKSINCYYASETDDRGVFIDLSQMKEYEEL